MSYCQGCADRDKALLCAEERAQRAERERDEWIERERIWRDLCSELVETEMMAARAGLSPSDVMRLYVGPSIEKITKALCREPKWLYADKALSSPGKEA